VVTVEVLSDNISAVREDSPAIELKNLDQGVRQTTETIGIITMATAGTAMIHRARGAES
jgi:hypothetical protein